MRLVMAVSRDGYMARSEDDDMSWLGSTDKAVFRILTGVNAWVGVSLKSARLMPSKLEGRSLLMLSNQPGQGWGCLSDFQRAHPDGWLIGGPTLALTALEKDMIDEVHLCRSHRMAFPVYDGRAVPDTVTPFLERERPWVGTWVQHMETTVLDVTVECWRKR